MGARVLERSSMIVAIAGQKGGAGKSTAAVHVACELHERGARVLLVDGDVQGSVVAFAEVAAEQGRAGPTVVAMGATMHRPGGLPALVGTFEHVVIDCPGRTDAVTRSALMVADVAVLPVVPSPVDAWALAGTVALVRDAQQLRPELRAVALLSRVQARTALGRSARGIVQAYGVEVLRAVLSARVAYCESWAAGQGITSYAPGDLGTCEVRRLVDELLALGAEVGVRHVA